MSKLRLSHMLTGLGLIWVGTCIYCHGPAILSYVGLQFVTSGVFAWAIHSSVKKHLVTAANDSTVRRGSDTDGSVRMEPATAHQAG